MLCCTCQHLMSIFLNPRHVLLIFNFYITFTYVLMHCLSKTVTWIWSMTMICNPTSWNTRHKWPREWHNGARTKWWSGLSTAFRKLLCRKWKSSVKQRVYHFVIINQNLQIIFSCFLMIHLGLQWLVSRCQLCS